MGFALDESGGYEQGGGSGGRTQKRFQRPPREEKDNSIIEDRIQRERPCRTLFIRNIKASCMFPSFNAALLAFILFLLT